MISLRIFFSFALTIVVTVACKPDVQATKSDTLTRGAELPESTLSTFLKPGESCKIIDSNRKEIIVTRVIESRGGRMQKPNYTVDVAEDFTGPSPVIQHHVNSRRIELCPENSIEMQLTDPWLTSYNSSNKGTIEIVCGMWTAMVAPGGRGVSGKMGAGSEKSIREYAAYHNSQIRPGGARDGWGVCTAVPPAN
jgi:hypothetical protein